MRASSCLGRRREFFAPSFVLAIVTLTFGLVREIARPGGEVSPPRLNLG